jgi:hypothetical protein
MVLMMMVVVVVVLWDGISPCEETFGCFGAECGERIWGAE